MSRATLYCGDVRDVLATLPLLCAQTVVTSPPYFGLRDYGMPGQIGLEPTPDEYVRALVEVFRGVRQCLRTDGTAWLNLGDSYAGSWGAQSRGNTAGEASSRLEGTSMLSARQIASHPLGQTGTGSLKNTPGLKPKDLIGIPWRVAFALQADGWYLRSEIIWHKPNPMPESVTDRPTKSHEHVFLLTKSERYYYDADAVREDFTTETGQPNAPDAIKSPHGQGFTKRASRKRGVPPRHAQYESSDQSGLDDVGRGMGRNARSVWSIATQPYSGAHFATFPEELARRCIVAGSKPGDTVLDPFGGSGTVAAVAVGHGRKAIHVDLNPAYMHLARERIGPMLCDDGEPFPVGGVA